MKIQLKPLNQQVIVITGASSGIELATAALAAPEGAKRVLVARSLQTLDAIAARIEADGGEGGLIHGLGDGNVAKVASGQGVQLPARRAAGGRPAEWPLMSA